ncbi:LamG-like jellyroll fold domain-containing protein [Nonlabens sp.]|uniref:LamG-like jellyroll fold domain-containing protein n=1 Tax=Nonlabens sp. TaxID=1888209 RepID=UPI001BD08803|nr:LamG-like jellyroll fold domain-containing protein [Nonlabens sp.]
MTSKILKLAMALLLLFTYSFASAQSWPPMGSRINGENPGDYFGNSVSISADGTILASGAPENDSSATNAGQVRIFEFNGTDWAQLGNTLVGNTASMKFGSRVSISEDGTLVAVGAPLHSTSSGNFSGQVQVFKNINGTWTQIGTNLYGEGNAHYFGWNLKLSGDGNRLLVSSYNAPGVNGNGPNGFGSGLVYAYEYDANTSTWIQLGSTIQGLTGALLGYALDMDYDGSHIAAGGYAYNSYQGLVQTFSYNSTNWVQTGSNIIGVTTGDSFGTSVSLSSNGTRLAVGSTGANGYVGNTRTFDFDSSTNDWVQVGSNLTGLATSNYYGSSVSLTSDGNKLAIGGMSGSGNNGYIRVFDFNTSTNDWVQNGSDLLGVADDLFFGWDVNFNNSGSVLATGTPYTSLGVAYSSEGGVTVFGNISTPTPCNAGSLWTSQTSAADNLWRGVTYGNGLYVAVASSGAGNRVMTSPDAITWTTQNSVVANLWRDVTYGNGLFVAVAGSGSGNRVMTSPDGINWTSRTSAADIVWNRVTYGNGLFVAVAGTGANRVMTSPDGITWTAQNAAALNVWNDVVYGNGLFVAVSNTGSSNRVMTSPDGINWTSRMSAADNSWNDITYGNGLFVAVAQTGTGNRVMTSPDGITWTAQLSAEDNVWLSVTYGNGLFVAVAGSGSNRVMTSPDGVTWTAHASAASNGWVSVIYENNMFVAVSFNGTGNRVMTSICSTVVATPTITYDATQITSFTSCSGTASAEQTLTVSGTDLTADVIVTAPTNFEVSLTSGSGFASSVNITASGTLSATTVYVRVTNSATSGAISGSLTMSSIGATDQTVNLAGTVDSTCTPACNAGISWMSQTTPADNNWKSVTYGNGLFVAVSISGAGNRVMTSPDGITWTSQTSAEDNFWLGVTYGNGLFVAVSSTGTHRVMTSPDGINWTARTAAAANFWTSITYDNDNSQFVAVALNGSNRVMTSPDGITWTSQTAAANESWFSVTYGNGLFVAVSTSGTGNRVMTSPDGITWTTRAEAVDNNWQSVTYGNGLFVAVASSGTGNRVMTSPDGITWTAQVSTEDNFWKSVIYGNGLFVAVASDGSNRVMTSPDGVTWTAQSAAASYAWTSVTYGNNMFVAVSPPGSGNCVMTSVCSTVVATPTITVDSTSISSFTACSGTASAEQTLTVSGTDLTADVMVTAPTNFEVSLTSGSGFASSVNITASGTLSATTVYVRVTNSATSGAISGSLTMSSIGATDQTVNLSGVVNSIFNLDSFLPISGTSGSTVTITGTTFTGVTAVKFNGVNAASFTVVDDNTITAITPSTLTDGKISLTTACGTVQSATDFTVAIAATPRIISNRSLNFDATAGQTVDINPMIPYSSSYTVMGWVNIIGSFSNIFTWGSPITNNYFKIETNFSGKLRYYVPSGGAVVESTTIIKNSGWVHIAVTNNAGSITLYVNGVAENTGTETRIITPTTSSMGAALLNGSIQGSNNGTIDELSIWNSALTNVDINNFMRDSPDGTETGVVAFYDFNNIYITPGGDNTSVSQATILTDMSGNGYTGTLSSFSLNGPTGNWVTTQIPSFTACSGTASAEQTLTVSGTDLTADVIVTAPTNFEVSLTSGSGFASSVNITASGTLSATTVYVRVTNSATSGAISGSLTMSSIGATDQTVSLTGVVNAISLTPASQTNVSCNSGANGSATVAVAGGTAGYTYSWAPSGGTAATASGLSAGAYTVTVTDANSCTATQSFTITEPTALVATPASQTNVSCNSGANGSATVAVAGGTPGYTYSWAPSGGTAATASGLSAGAYTVTVTDANSCTAKVLQSQSQLLL